MSREFLAWIKHELREDTQIGVVLSVIAFFMAGVSFFAYVAIALFVLTEHGAWVLVLFPGVPMAIIFALFAMRDRQ